MSSADQALAAFGAVEFHSVFDLQEIWMDRPAGHVPLQERALHRFQESLQRAINLRTGNPKGLSFIGQAGSGKTHFLGEIRREAARQGANFVLGDLTDLRDFWPLLTMGFLRSLQEPKKGIPQRQLLLETLRQRAGNPPEVGGNFDGSRSFWRDSLVKFADESARSLRSIYRDEIRARHRTLRALLYLGADEFEESDLSDRGWSFLQGIEQIDDESKTISLSGPNSAKSVVEDLAWYLSLRGPTVLAFDQLDPLVAQNNLAGWQEPAGVREREALQVLFGFINGVLAIHEAFPRTLVVLTCLESSWKVLQERAPNAFCQRFEDIEPLRAITDREVPRELVALRLDEGYRSFGFAPPYRTWPFAPGFFESIVPGLTPREILNRCEKHRLDCATSGEVKELKSYGGEVAPVVSLDRKTTRLDERLASESNSIDPAVFLDEKAEDELGRLLGEAAHLFRHELPFEPSIDVAVEDDFHVGRRQASLHLRLRRIFRTENDREEHVCARNLQKTNARAFQTRLRDALTASGASENLDGRRLALLRNSDPPSGPKSTELLKQAQEWGAKFIHVQPDDIKTMAAVVGLSHIGDPLFKTWLLQKRPLSGTTLFRQLVPKWLGSEDTPAEHAKIEPAKTGPDTSTCSSMPPPDITAPMPPVLPSMTTPPKPPEVAKQEHAEIILGYRLEAGRARGPVYLPVTDLACHVLIRAGSGGGKTVLIKRLVEESAMSGIPSIVIDTAGDLSRLGDRWPHPPSEWGGDEIRLAELYHKTVNVRIWTPGHSGGRPLRVAPLPNLSGPFDEPHDREQVVENTVASLLPLAVQKKNATIERAILKKVVEWLTQEPPHAGSELDRLIAGLRDLPPETIQGYQNERKLAGGMADQIQASLIADSLSGGYGEDLDPAVLFATSPRTRISILSLFALPDIETQARFIGRVADVLFNWIRRNPDPAGRPVRGLFVLDEAAGFLPRGNAASKAGLMLLARQARKYGLGLILATQNPMDLDYNATANFSTQIFGRANTPQVVGFIQKEMEQRGLQAVNPGELKTGQFYCVTASLERPVRLQAPLCLSYHPHNIQLREEEILSRAIGTA